MITGASSGIGEALAKAYAANGIKLYISGRDKERLSAVADACKTDGAIVEAKVIDVTDKNKMSEWVSTLKPLDLVIANAGIGTPFKFEDDLAEKTEEIFDVNLKGVFNTVHPAIKIMKEQSFGQVALISSVAGYRGMPSAPLYSASKVAVKAYGEALRGFYHDHNIQVNVICPGFVRSRITDQNDFSMPFFMEAPKAAEIIKQGLSKNKGLITFPWQMRLIMGALIRLVPKFILEKILRQLPEK